MWEKVENLSLVPSNDRIYPDISNILKTKDSNFSQNLCTNEQWINDFLLKTHCSQQSWRAAKCHLLRNLDWAIMTVFHLAPTSSTTSCRIILKKLNTERLLFKITRKESIEHCIAYVFMVRLHSWENYTASSSQWTPLGLSSYHKVSILIGVH